MYIEVVSPSAVPPELFAAPALEGEAQTLTVALRMDGFAADEPMEGSVSVSSTIFVPLAVERTCVEAADDTPWTLTF